MWIQHRDASSTAAEGLSAYAGGGRTSGKDNRDICAAAEKETNESAGAEGNGLSAIQWSESFHAKKPEKGSEYQRPLASLQ